MPFRLIASLLITSCRIADRVASILRPVAAGAGRAKPAFASTAPSLAAVKGDAAVEPWGFSQTGRQYGLAFPC